MARTWLPARRHFISGAAATVAAAGVGSRVQADDPPIRFGLTPVFLTSDLALLADLKLYLENATGHSVHLVTRRTYQEITALLVSRQLDAAWICGFPFVAYRSELALLAVPVWHGRPLYQSYLITHVDQQAERLQDLRGSIHAFSDPDSNSGYLVTRTELAALGERPFSFFRHYFFTYGHRNVIRAVSAGLATSGSVDGYVYEVLRETEPSLITSTKVIHKSEWLGFPPIAAPAAAAASGPTLRLQQALLSMTQHAVGRRILALLQLDGFRIEPPGLFDAIADKMRTVRREEPL